MKNPKQEVTAENTTWNKIYIVVPCRGASILHDVIYVIKIDDVKVIFNKVISRQQTFGILLYDALLQSINYSSMHVYVTLIISLHAKLLQHSI